MTVDYQTVGTLTDQGRIDELADLTAIGTMVFWVVPDEANESNLRVDEISGAPAGTDPQRPGAHRVLPDPADLLLGPDVHLARAGPAVRAADDHAHSAGEPGSCSGSSPGRRPGSAAAPSACPSTSPATRRSTDNGTLVVKLSPQAASGRTRWSAPPHVPAAVVAAHDQHAADRAEHRRRDPAGGRNRDGVPAVQHQQHLRPARRSATTSTRTEGGPGARAACQAPAVLAARERQRRVRRDRPRRHRRGLRAHRRQRAPAADRARWA